LRRKYDDGESVGPDEGLRANPEVLKLALREESKPRSIQVQAAAA